MQSFGEYLHITWSLAFEEFVFAEISISTSTAASQTTLRLMNSECNQVRFAGMSPTCRSAALFAAACITKSGYEICRQHNFDIYMLLCVMGHPCPCNPIKELLIPASNAHIQDTMIENEHRPLSEVSWRLSAELFFFQRHVCFILQISKTTVETELTANQFYSQALNI